MPVAVGGSKASPAGIPPDFTTSPEVGLNEEYGEVILISGEQRRLITQGAFKK